MPEKPLQEFWVALAGPAVNLAVAAVLLVLLLLSGTLGSLADLSLTRGAFFTRLMLVNLTLAFFNLIPAFPMDGGRVVRSLLALKIEYTRATNAAALLGQGIALIFAVVGLFYNPFLIFIAFFVWIGAAQESSMVQMKSALAGIPVGRAMVTNFQTISTGESLNRAVELILSGSQTDFPVVDDGNLVGVLTRADLLAALSRPGQAGSVREIMRTDLQTADAGEMLEPAFARLQACSCHTMPVLRGGQLVGLLTSDNIGEFMMIQTALKNQPSDRLAGKNV